MPCAREATLQERPRPPARRSSRRWSQGRWAARRKAGWRQASTSRSKGAARWRFRRPPLRASRGLPSRPPPCGWRPATSGCRFVRATRHPIRDDSVDPDGRQQQRQDSEKAGKRRQQALLRERVRLLLGERLEPRYRHVPVETPQDLSKHGYIGGRVAGSSQIVGPVVEGGRSPVLIAVGVGRRRRRLVNPSQILGDSDDLILRGEAPPPRDFRSRFVQLADRLAAGEDKLGQGLVDHHHLYGVRGILRRKGPAAHDLVPHGRKEIAADGKAKSKTGNVRIRLGAALGEYVVQAQRKFIAGGVTDGPYAGNCLQPRFQLPAEDGGLGRGIPDAADAARDDGRHERVLRIQAQVHRRRVAQALHEKAGAGYQ